MKWFPYQLCTTDPEQRDAEATGRSGDVESSDTDESAPSTSVSWSDLSRRTAGPVGTVERLDQPSTAPREEVDAGSPTNPADSWLLEAVLDEIDEATLLVDDRGEIIQLNTAACELFGTTESEAVGVEPSRIHGGDRLALQVGTTGEPVVKRCETLPGIGDNHRVRRCVVPLTNDEGAVAATMETITPIEPAQRTAEADDIDQK